MFQSCVMRSTARNERCLSPFIVAALAGCFVLAFALPAARAQMGSMGMRRGMMMPQMPFSPAMSTQMSPFFPPGGPINSFAGFNNGRFGSPFGPYANGYTSYYGNAYGGAAMNGNLYGAYAGMGQTGYANNYSNSNPYLTSVYGSGEPYSQVGTDRTAERLANRHKAFDEARYERERTPTAEESREQSQRQQLLRSLNHPPVTEILSAKALNDILADLRKFSENGVAADLHDMPLPLDKAALAHINVTRGAGSIGLLRNEGRTKWAPALAGPDYMTERERLTQKALEAILQVEFNGCADSGTLEQMQADVDSLFKQLREKGSDLSFFQYMEAKGFLHHFEAAIKALRQPDVWNHFNGKYALQARTVAELVAHMADQGLDFAPALPGDDRAYVALHQTLAEYHQAAQSRTASR